MVQRLGLGALTAVAWVQSLVGELRSCKVHDVGKEGRKEGREGGKEGGKKEGREGKEGEGRGGERRAGQGRSLKLLSVLKSQVYDCHSSHHRDKSEFDKEEHLEISFSKKASP